MSTALESPARDSDPPSQPKPRSEPVALRDRAPTSLRRRVGRAFVAMLALLTVLLVIVGVFLFRFKERGNEVINRWQPAATLGKQLLADVVEQQDGVRGYALGRQPEFLKPYTQYRSAERSDARRLHGLVAGHPDLTARLDAFEHAAQEWRTTAAEPLIARVRAAAPTASVVAAGGLRTSKFDAVRADSAQLTDAIGQAQESAKNDRSSAIRYLEIVIVVTAVVILLGVGALWRGLRRQVLDPVESLAGQTREVAAGDVSRVIAASGPPEIAALGTDVDAMRARIADDLARVEQARVDLMARTNDLARSNADLEQFAYVASHDLSEPLRKVANFCQLLERQYGTQLDDKARQYIYFAVDGAKRMQILIGDLLAFSRVGRTTEQFAAIDLDVMLANALANLDDRIRADDARVVADPLPTIEGDPTLLAALLQNLVGNALKYRADDPPRVEIRVVAQDDGYLFTVADNGIGIETKYGERIFAIFQRLHLRDQYGGTGIGLALCRKIVEFHGGRIWLADSDGPGATFCFTLPSRQPASSSESLQPIRSERR